MTSYERALLDRVAELEGERDKAVAKHKATLQKYRGASHRAKRLGVQLTLARVDNARLRRSRTRYRQAANRLAVSTERN